MKSATPKLPALLAAIGPGLLVAATGVGAGDLATASIVGANLGLVVLWAALLGSFFKFVVSEGLTRWQLATGKTLLEGCVEQFGLPFRILFITYLIAWSFFVGTALAGACGVATHAMIPIVKDPVNAKIVWGIANSALGLALVWLGGYKLFQRTMKLCIAVMFVTVFYAAIRLVNDWPGVFSGIALPRIPIEKPDAIRQTIALMGGVGGTLTIICYGYWIRAEGRASLDTLRTCRIDLFTGYLFTGLFGAAMVIIGNRIHVEGEGARLVVVLAEALETPLGPIGKWAFLLGAYGAVFSSLLGVWQAVPLIFADFWRMRSGFVTQAQTAALEPLENTRAYTIYLIAIATIPLIGLRYSFKDIQLLYSTIGAYFCPALALALLYLNNRKQLVGPKNTNHPITNLVLLIVLAYFIATAWYGIE
jgi:Mn2+/Fe2+ NRAMP family transporter